MEDRRELQPSERRCRSCAYTSKNVICPSCGIDKLKELGGN